MSLARPILATPPSVVPDQPWAPTQNNYWWHPQSGHYPDTTQLLPGDVVLFRPNEPNFVHGQIRSYQEKRHAAIHASYTHAALYVGLDHILCESRMKGGIHLSSLETRLKGSAYSLLFRRVKGVTLEQRQATARIAVGFRGGPYGWRTIMKAKLPHFLTRLHTQFEAGPARDSLVCSQLCEMAIARGMRVSLLPRDLGLVTPAVLSESARLEDIAVGWCKVVPLRE